MDNGVYKKDQKKAVSFIISAVIVLVSLIFVFIITLTGNRKPVYSIDNGVFRISSMYGQEISLSDISSVQLKDGLPSNLSRVNGYGFGTTIKGKCKSDMGEVTVYIDTSKSPFIYIKTPSEWIILNDQTAEETESLYENLISSVNNS